MGFARGGGGGGIGVRSLQFESFFERFSFLESFEFFFFRVL